MTSFLTKLLNIRREEFPRFIYLYAMFFLGITGFIWGNMIVTGAFLQQVGVEFLPLAIIINALVSILLTVIYSAFADRVSNDHLLIAILGLSGVGIIMGLVALRQQRVSLAYPLLYMIIRVPLQAIFNVHWATYVNGFYDTRSAKRIVPVLSSGVRFASIVAGATMPLLNKILPAEGIVIIWLVAVILMAAMTWLMPYIIGDDREGRRSQRFNRLAAAPAATPETDKSADLAETLRNVRTGYHYVTGSKFLRWLAVATLAMMILLAFIDYQTGKIMLDRLGTAQAISNFTGLLNAISNAIVLPIQIFLLSRLIGRIGLGNAAILFPVSTLVTSVGLLAVPSISAATLGHLNRSTFRTLFYNPINSLLYNAVPVRVKGRARAFIGGIVVPLGSLLGGVLLLLPQNIARLPVWFLPALIGMLTVAYIAGMWATRKHYTEALIAMLEQEDFSFLMSQEPSELTVADARMLEKLAQELRASKSHELTAFMAKLITQVGGNKSIPILGAAVRETSDARTRAAILNVLLASDLRGDAARDLYADFLDDADSRVRQSAVAGLAQVTQSDDHEFRDQMVAMVDDEDMEVRLQVLKALVHDGSFFQLEPAAKALDDMLADGDPEVRAAGIELLGEIGSNTSLRQVLNYFNDPSDRVRLEAVLAVEARTLRTITDVELTNEIEREITQLLDDPVERIRQGAVTILGQIGGRSTSKTLAACLGDPSPQIRATIVEILAARGKNVIPIMHPKLDASDSQVRRMAMVTLSRINPKEYGPLIVAEIIHGNLLTTYRYDGLAQALAPLTDYPTVAILQTALREHSQALADEVFYFLSAIHDPAAVNVIQSSLKSDSPHLQANAIEALEGLTTPQTARLIAPLFESDAGPEQRQAISQEAWEMDQPTAARGLHELLEAETDAWFRALAVASLGEMGAALISRSSPPQSDSPALEKESDPLSALDGLTAKLTDSPSSSGSRRRRKPPADLFGALMGDGDQGQDGNSEDGHSEDQEGPDQDKAARQNGVDSDLIPLELSEIERLITQALSDRQETVQVAAKVARRALDSARPSTARGSAQKEIHMLSTIEKIIFLKEVPFFQGMTIDQLRILAEVCEEQMFDEDTTIYSKDDAGGVLYVVVNGRVGIEQEKRTGSARLATLGAYGYFGEMNLFDNSPRTTSALAIQDTLTLRLRREPLIALARRHPELSLELINVLSQRLRESNTRIAELTRSRPRELHKLFDKFD